MTHTLPFVHAEQAKFCHKTRQLSVRFFVSTAAASGRPQKLAGRVEHALHKRPGPANYCPMGIGSMRPIAAARASGTQRQLSKAKRTLTNCELLGPKRPLSTSLPCPHQISRTVCKADFSRTTN